MMIQAHKAILFTLFIGLTACTTTSGPTGYQPSPLQPAPVGSVQADRLPPLGTNPPSQGQLQANSPFPDQPTGYTPPANIASASGSDLQAIPDLPPSSSGVSSANSVTVSPNIDFNRNAVLGSWNVSSQTDTCALNLSLTTWNGGFRASTRKCSNTNLVNVGAWSLNGKNLTLLDATGGVIARLTASGANRFDGTTQNGGNAISVFR